jgi:hypothetical protein
MKIRLEGNETEIQNVIKLVKFNYKPNGEPVLDIKSVSKFYPNRVNSADLLNGLVKTGAETIGRVYVEMN